MRLADHLKDRIGAELADWQGAQLVGCALLSGAARAVAERDVWIGWRAQARRQNLPRVLNNSRFLIFPHVRRVRTCQPRLPQRPGHPLAQRVPRTRAGRYRSAETGLRAAWLRAFERAAQEALPAPPRTSRTLSPPAPCDLTASAAKSGAPGKPDRFGRVMRQGCLLRGSLACERLLCESLPKRVGVVTKLRCGAAAGGNPSCIWADRCLS
ncbi:Druantia anti-phage system protein DruA [Accumulibacter sp.]|uniref:Druantia anti-phage system protein DruA n=1 Tax=Accumulibacter sp. TaxID=2053492 RepID=UPI0025FDCB39|nr:Druantia anti-phage system protein DruA [Accumulibacter sp.]MCM8612274.1 DUF4338 domain-containing protein [Accumulibacter sp.]MCM8635947.1 DUF4338 domain-containing protein [Accumulibacter sp.]MCM8639444.1 DUF4338 domain-containing protein [Accumulibacter sp.]